MKILQNSRFMNKIISHKLFFQVQEHIICTNNLDFGVFLPFYKCISDIPMELSTFNKNLELILTLFSDRFFFQSFIFNCF